MAEEKTNESRSPADKIEEAFNALICAAREDKQGDVAVVAWMLRRDQFEGASSWREAYGDGLQMYESGFGRLPEGPDARYAIAMAIRAMAGNSDGGLIEKGRYGSTPCDELISLVYQWIDDAFRK